MLVVYFILRSMLMALTVMWDRTEPLLCFECMIFRTVWGMRGTYTAPTTRLQIAHSHTKHGFASVGGTADIMVCVSGAVLHAELLVQSAADFA